MNIEYTTIHGPRWQHVNLDEIAGKTPISDAVINALWQFKKTWAACRAEPWNKFVRRSPPA